MKTKHLHSLDTSSIKFSCPKCGQKTFVRFKNNETGQYLGEKLGRCDREVKCGYFERPEKEDPNAFSVTPIWVLKKTLRDYDKNVLIRTLTNRFGFDAVNQVMKKFYIGTGYGKYEGWTIFWQVDHVGWIRTGHLMNYNGLKRSKYMNWTHSLLGGDYKLKQCLFGMNQLRKISKDKQINIVESEKTALIGGIYFPNETWMATAGKNRLKADDLIWLYPHPIHIYPDNDSVSHWKTITKGMKGVSVIDWQQDFFGYAYEIKNLEQGSDIADFLVKHTPQELKQYSVN